MHRTAVLNVVGLTPELVGPDTPALAAWAARGRSAPIATVTPAVTCSVQATYLTGCHPGEHGIVGNGWYVHDECEVRFWRQSNKLVGAPKIWELARAKDPSFTCANLFWWYNMYSTADYSVTPRPMYPADGRKLPDVYSHPARLRGELQAQLGTFPLFDFWGPRAGIRSSRWIADAAMRVEDQLSPTLSLIYLPHLDYNLQRLGPSSPAIAEDLRAVDALCGELIEYFERRGVRVLVLSEYGIVDVSRPIHINRVLREHGLLVLREELGRELLDAGASAAFAVADHQVAHVYVNDPARAEEVRALLVSTPGVELVLDQEGKRAYHIDHPRAGTFVAISEPDAWFTYYYWMDDERAPDYARTVDIHRKPGYDPAELFIDPAIRMPRLKVGLKLLRRKLGFRTLLDVIPLDASLVRGSHGRVTDSPNAGPLAITQQSELLPEPGLGATQVCQLILDHVFR